MTDKGTSMGTYVTSLKDTAGSEISSDNWADMMSVMSGVPKTSDKAVFACLDQKLKPATPNKTPKPKVNHSLKAKKDKLQVKKEELRDFMHEIPYRFPYHAISVSKTSEETASTDLRRLCTKTTTRNGS